MLSKLFIAGTIILAVGAGILFMVLRPEQLLVLIPIHDFFENMLPILGVGALIKYLCTFQRPPYE